LSISGADLATTAVKPATTAATATSATSLGRRFLGVRAAGTSNAISDEGSADASRAVRSVSMRGDHRTLWGKKERRAGPRGRAGRVSHSAEENQPESASGAELEADEARLCRILAVHKGQFLASLAEQAGVRAHLTEPLARTRLRAG
jgi:hypothetical protein